MTTVTTPEAGSTNTRGQAAAGQSAAFTIDDGGRISGWSVSACRLLGYAPDEVVGRPLAWVVARRSEPASGTGEGVAPGTPGGESAVAARHASGDLVRATMMVEALDGVPGRLVVLTDMAGREQLERELVRRELALARLPVLSDLGRALVHPLQMLLGLSERALLDAGNGPGAGPARLHEIRDHAMAASALLRNLVGVPVATAEGEVIAPHELLEAVLETATDETAAADVEVRTEWDRTASVTGDRELLTEASARLVASGLEVARAHGRGPLTVRTTARDGWVQVTVEGGRGGIAEAVTGPGPGRAAGLAGLGRSLAICQDILVGYGGFLSVCRSPGGATSYTMNLPAAGAASRARADACQFRPAA